MKTRDPHFAEVGRHTQLAGNHRSEQDNGSLYRRPRCLAIQHTKQLGMRITATAGDAGKGKAALVSGRLVFHGLHIHPKHPHKFLRIITYGA